MVIPVILGIHQKGSMMSDDGIGEEWGRKEKGRRRTYEERGVCRCCM